MNTDEHGPAEPEPRGCPTAEAAEGALTSQRKTEEDTERRILFFLAGISPTPGSRETPI